MEDGQFCAVRVNEFTCGGSFEGGGESGGGVRGWGGGSRVERAGESEGSASEGDGRGDVARDYGLSGGVMGGDNAAGGWGGRWSRHYGDRGGGYQCVWMEIWDAGERWDEDGM